MLDTKKEGATSDHPLNSIHGSTNLDKSDAIFSAIEKDFEDVVNEPPPTPRGRPKSEPIALPDGIRYNVITHNLCYNGKPLDNKTEHELWWAVPGKRRPSFDAFHRQLIAQAPRWNPNEEFFAVPWSGDDQFQLLKTFIRTPNPDKYVLHLRKHMTRGINQLFTAPTDPNYRINRYVFVYQGPSNIGKSTLIRAHNLYGMLPNFCSEFDLGASTIEVQKLLCQVVNLINEEIDNVSLREVRSLKPLISYPGGEIRMPYDKTPTTFTRMATLWASVNPSEFLTEIASRWIVFPVDGIDYKYSETVDFPDMWRQCYALWQQDPLSGEMTTEENKDVCDQAEGHRSVSSLEQFLGETFEGSFDGKAMSLDLFRYELRESPYRQVSDKVLGTVLSTLFPSFKVSRANGKRGAHYYVKMRSTQWPATSF